VGIARRYKLLKAPDAGGGGGGTDADAIHVNVADEISAIANKATIAAGDFFVIEDSEAAGVKKHVIWSDLISGFDGDYLRIDCTNDPLTATLEAQTILPDTTLLYDIGSETVRWDELHARTAFIGANTGAATLDFTGNGSIMAVLADGPLSVSMQGDGSAVFGKNTITGGGTAAVMRANHDNSWQFGPGTTSQEGEMHIGAAGNTSGLPADERDDANSGVRLTTEGMVYVMDGGAFRLGSGNRAQPIGTGWWDAEIEWVGGSNLLRINPASGINAGASRWVHIGNSSTSAANLGLRAGHVFVDDAGLGTPNSGGYLALDAECRLRFGSDSNPLQVSDFEMRWDSVADALYWNVDDDIGNGGEILTMSLGRAGDLTLWTGNYVTLTGGLVIWQDSTDVDVVTAGHDGVDFNFTTTGGTTAQYTFDSAVQIAGDINHDGTNIGFYGATPVNLAAGLTAALTTITHTAPTPDYAVQDFVDAVTGAWAFADKDEANTLLSVVANLQVRVNELEAALDATTGVGLIT
jgi:hypothetical protein